MAHTEPPETAPIGEAAPTVVWLRGEHDVATRVNLSLSIAQAAGLDDGNVVVDLSGVTFMDASTVGAIVGARNRLRSRSRSLSLRAPSRSAFRLLDVCGLASLIDHRPAPSLQPAPAASALGTWVDVPPTDREPGADAARQAVRATAPRQLVRPADRQGAEQPSLLGPGRPLRS